MRKSTWLLTSLLIATAACDQPPTSTEVEPLFSHATSLNVSLSGTVTYYTYASKTKELLQNAAFDADATVELLGDHEIRMTLNEYELGRVTVLEGSLAPGGVLKMVYVGPPADLIKDIVRGHSGCTIAGPFPVYHGAFDGTEFDAETAFNSQCPVYWAPNDIFPTPVDGAVHWKWIIHMTVSP